MTWRLAESLEQLRKQINALYPKRSKLSDGSIGDPRHRRTKSDHNPNSKGVVQAIDVTHDPKNGMDCNKLAAALAKNKDPRIKYLIWNRQILSSTTAAWKWRNYTGVNGHTKHVHISVNSKYDQKGNWKLDLEKVEALVHHNPDLIEHGDKGFAVNKLQTDLAALKYLKSRDVDGIFGLVTKKAVLAFQSNEGLDADGIAGPITLARIKKRLEA